MDIVTLATLAYDVSEFIDSNKVSLGIRHIINLLSKDERSIKPDKRVESYLEDFSAMPLQKWTSEEQNLFRYMGLSSAIGTDASDKIRSMFDEVNVSKRRKEAIAFRSEYNAKVSNLRNIGDMMTYFRIKPVTNRKQVATKIVFSGKESVETLGGLRKSIENVEKLIGMAQRVAKEDPSEVGLKGVSNGSIELVIDPSLSVILVLGIVLDYVFRSMKNYYEIELQKQNLKRLKVGNDEVISRIVSAQEINDKEIRNFVIHKVMKDAGWNIEDPDFNETRAVASALVAHTKSFVKDGGYIYLPDTTEDEEHNERTKEIPTPGKFTQLQEKTLKLLESSEEEDAPVADEEVAEVEESDND